MKKILVIDGNSIINRAFFGVRPLTTRDGKNTNAVFGAVNIISRQLDAIRPDYAAVAFDRREPTFRHKMFDAYKAGRRPTPPELLEQFPYVKDILTAMGLHVLELPGYEADDIQGTVASFANSAADTESYILTGDRDLLQLIGDKISVLLATNADTVLMRRPQFMEKYGVEPECFVDMKAIMGDTSDNIPGVRGIGEKGAAALISDFGSLDEIYAHLDDARIKPAVRAKLEASKEDAYLSRALAKIDTSAPLTVTLEDLAVQPMDKGELYRLFSSLELRSFITKFGLDGAQAPALTEIKEAKAVEYGEGDAPLPKAGMRVAIERMGETVCLSDGENHRVIGGTEALRPLCEAGVTFLCTDAKGWMHALRESGIAYDACRFLDLGIYAYVLSPGSNEADVASLCSVFLGVTPAAGRPAAHLFFDLEKAMREKIEDAGMEKILDGIELPLIGILADMEACGLMIDRAGMAEFGTALGELAKELTARIYLEAGRQFNLNSPKQLADVLYNELGLASFVAKKGKGTPGTDAQTLEELRPYAPIVEDILEYRQVTKLKSTYTDVLTAVADQNDRVHTDFKQAQTATGRLSSADPNLQNIPIRTKLGRQMRKYFIAKPGYTLVDADYSQIELRLLAHMASDKNMIDAFVSGEDIHRKTAAAVFGVAEEEVTEEMRKSAKAVNFGIVYGIGAYSLSKDIGTSVAAANRYIKSYMEEYPSIASYLEDTVKEATEKGYSTTVLGRRRYIPELRASNKMTSAFGKRVAMNAPIQGTAADVIKLAMIRVYERLKKEVPEAKLVMQVHDELIIEAPKEKARAVGDLLKEEMEGVVRLKVPMTAEVTMGDNWLDQE